MIPHSSRNRCVLRFACYLLRISFCALLIAFCVVPAVFGQTSTATLSGTVTDERDAVIPGAAVTMVNTATGARRQTTTNEQGGFVVPLLPPATYVINVQQQGFAPLEVRGVVLNVGDNKGLQIELKAGDVNAQVTIDSDAETVRTDGSVGTVVNRQFVANIPLNGRSLQALVQLTPGVVLTAPATGGTATGGQQFSVNGQRSTTNYYMVDGVSANTGIATSFGGTPEASGSGQTPGTTALGGTNSLVSLDALQEFRIETSSYAAEYGRVPGGQISLVTRGGTNQFHGSVSEYFRSDALDANDWFANANRLPKPKERQHLFGGVLGGPLYLPRFGEGGPSLWSGKDRLFFFASYEGLRLEQPQARIVTVPTADLRAQAALGLRPYLNAFPLPNGQGFGDGTAQFAASYSDPATFNIFALRLDGRLTNRLTGFFRLNHAPSESKSRDGSLSEILSTQVRADSYTGGVTWVASSGLSADVRVNWTRNAPSSVAYLDTLGGAVVPNPSDVFLATGRDWSNSFSTFNGPGGTNFLWGTGNTDVQRQFNTVGTLAWSVGTHQLKFGVDYRRMLPLLGGTGLNGEVVGVFTQQQALAGQLGYYAVLTNDPVPREPVITNLSLFAQDTWHAARRLTFTYGIRFERVPSPGEATGRLPRGLLGVENGLLVNPRLAPVGAPLFSRRFGEFAPRFGVAYQLSTSQGWETTIRGGGGIFYDVGLGYIADAFQFAFPFSATSQINDVLLPLSAADRTPPSVPVTTPGDNDTFFFLDSNIRLPYTIQWNGAIEQSLGSAQTVTASYVAAAGRRLLYKENYLTSLADFTGVQEFLSVQHNLSKSAYKSLQLQYRRRLVRGLQALASYTLASSQDDASDDVVPGVPVSQASVLAREYAPSSFDVRHVFSGAITYDLPKPSGPALLQALSRGWGLDALMRYQSALPVNVFLNGFVRFADGTAFRLRPDVVSGQPLYLHSSSYPGGMRFNPAAFTRPAAGQQGNLPRNGLRWLPASQVDLALRRDFRLAESMRLQIRGELFNLFNHPNFGLPNNNGSAGTVGLSNQMLNRGLGGLNQLYQMGGPRSGQLGIKILF
jgi:hypothetical protein